MIYQWKDGWKPPVDANVAGQELVRIEREQGSITPAAVVEAAMPAHSPLHQAFEWDDAKCGIAHRENQARYLLRHIVVVVQREEEERTPRAFVNVRLVTQDDSEEEAEEPERCYVAVERAMTTPELRTQVLQDALREMEQLRRRYSELVELTPVFQALAGVKERLQLAS